MKKILIAMLLACMVSPVLNAGLFISFRIDNVTHKIYNAVSYEYTKNMFKFTCTDGKNYYVPYSFIKELTIKED